MEVGSKEPSTKERILATALNLFSEKGYFGTSMSDIADELGMTKAALYRHYQGKKEILDSLVQDGEEFYKRQMKSEEIKCPTTAEELYQLSMSQITFTINNPTIRKFRKMISIEQFQDEKIASLATRHLCCEVSRMYMELFRKMMDEGLFKKDDPEIIAYEFSSTVSLMIALCDRQPEQHDYAMNIIDRHIRHFIKTYSVNNNPEGKKI